VIEARNPDAGIDKHRAGVLGELRAVVVRRPRPPACVGPELVVEILAPPGVLRERELSLRLRPSRTASVWGSGGPVE
jgi:hypothetical protein